jgi:acetyl-CoA carboxylase biotin carboxyl carrier protein
MEIQKITQLMDLLSRSDLTELHLQEGEDLLKLVRSVQGELHPKRPSTKADVQPAGAERPAEKAAPAAVNETRHIFKSPMVGTFFRAGSPGTAPFVEMGARVAQGQTLGVIEAMKMLTEIESEVEGEIVEILVENGAFVEFGQPLFAIETLAMR